MGEGLALGQFCMDKRGKLRPCLGSRESGVGVGGRTGAAGALDKLPGSQGLREQRGEPDRLQQKPGGGLSEPQSLQLYNGQAHTSVPQKFNKTKSKGRLILVLTKKNVQCEMQIKFYLGPCEGCSPGDRSSDNSEQRLQRDREKTVYM